MLNVNRSISRVTVTNHGLEEPAIGDITAETAQVRKGLPAPTESGLPASLTESLHEIGHRVVAMLMNSRQR